ncbi:MAG: hypothetical protein ACRDAX_03275 [Propionibacteriaceae bacterium]
MVKRNILFARPGLGDVIRAILTDWSGAGLVQPFLWVQPESMEQNMTPGLFIENGIAHAMTMESFLAQGATNMVRVGVVNPLRKVNESSAVVSAEQETALLNAINMVRPGQDTKLLRCIFSTGQSDELPVALARDGSHTLILSPETSDDPTQGIEPLPSNIDDESLGCHAAAGLAGICGLWSGLEDAPFDRITPPPSGMARLVRTHLRWADGASLDKNLRSAAFSLQQIPRPHTEGGVAISLPDPATATRATAKAVWDKHQQHFFSGRQPMPAQEQHKIGLWKAIKMLLSFLVKSLFAAPGAWLRGTLASARSGLENAVQGAVFGEGSAFTVISAGGLRKSGNVAASMHGIDAMMASLNVAQEGAPQLPALWQDYIFGAQDLIDAGGRLALDVQRVQSQWGIVPDPSFIAPHPTDMLVVDPALQSVIGRSVIEGYDANGLATSNNALQYCAMDQTSPVRTVAAAALRSVHDFQQRRQNSYTATVGNLLQSKLESYYTEAEGYSQQLQHFNEAGNLGGEIEQQQRSLAKTMRIMLLIAVLLSIGSICLGAFAVLAWSVVAAICVAIFLGWFASSIAVFMSRQKRLFQLLNTMSAAGPCIDVLTTNVGRALRDARTVLSAYDQFLAWSRILSAFVYSPFGIESDDDANEVAIVSGLPKNVKLGKLVEPSEAFERTVYHLRQHQFPKRWMDAPWEIGIRHGLANLNAAGMGVADWRDLYRMSPEGGGSPLGLLSEKFFSQGMPKQVGDLAWSATRQVLSDKRDQFEFDSANVESASGVQSEADFIGKFTQRLTGLPFTITLLQNSAIAIRDNLALDDQHHDCPWIKVLPGRLGRGVVRVEYTEALSPEKFKLTDDRKQEDYRWTS